MAQPPGSETRASPQRASRGPRTKTLARIFRTRSYGATVSTIARARSVIAWPPPDPPPRRSPPISTPIGVNRFAMVAMSARSGTFDKDSTPSVKMLAAMIGRAAFLAPLIGMAPESGLPPLMRILSNESSCGDGSCRTVSAADCVQEMAFLIQRREAVSNRATHGPQAPATPGSATVLALGRRAPARLRLAAQEIGPKRLRPRGGAVALALDGWRRRIGSGRVIGHRTSAYSSRLG